jgi:hypothetical protein
MRLISNEKIVFLMGAERRGENESRVLFLSPACGRGCPKGGRGCRFRDDFSVFDGRVFIRHVDDRAIAYTDMS